MPDLPPWIDRRIDRNLDNKLSQRHLVEVMLDADRPFFSIRQLQSRVKPDVGTGTVRNRLEELRELDVVAAETYPESITLYYVNHPDSEWPLPPEARRELTPGSPLDTLSVEGFLTLRDTAGIRTLVLAGFQLSLFVFGLGTVMIAAGVETPIYSDHRMWTTALVLCSVCVLLLLAERVARRLREWRRGRSPIRTTVGGSEPN